MKLGDIVTVDEVKKADATSPIPVASTDTIYTPSFPLIGVETAEFLAASDGAVDVLIELEVGSAIPSTEESSDTNWAEPDGLEDIVNLTDKVVHVRDIDNTLGKYGRFKMTGQGANDSSTTVQIKLQRRERP